MEDASGDYDSITLSVSNRRDNINVSCEWFHRTTLHRSARGNEYHFIKMELDTDCDVNVRSRNNNTPLHYAATYGHCDCASLLLDRGANVNAINSAGMTPLHCAANYNHLLNGKDFQYNHFIVRLLLNRGANVNARNNKMETPLHLAAASNLVCVYELLKWKADVHARDENKETPLQVAKIKGIQYVLRAAEAKVPYYLYPHHAAWCGDLEALKGINKQNINDLDEDGMAPLHIAVTSANVDIVEYLLTEGAQVNIRDKRKATPLHYATWHGLSNVISVLLKHSADINAKNFDEDTPLHLAISNCQLMKRSYDVVWVLLDKGADIHAKNSNQNTALHIAAKYCEVNIVCRLLALGADINVKNSDMETPLHLANSYFYDSVGVITVFVLLKWGADVMAKNSQNKKPVQVSDRSFQVQAILREAEAGKTYFLNLHYASLMGDLEGVKYFIKKEDNINKLKDNLSPLHFAVISGYKNVVEYLLNEGAIVDIKNELKMTPLHYAAYHGQPTYLYTLHGNFLDNLSSYEQSSLCIADIVRMLLKHGANINALNLYEQTPLYVAILRSQARENVPNLVQVLLEEGADIHIKNTRKETVLHLAAKLGKIGIVRRLLEMGADINVKNSDVKTPLDLATQFGERIVVEMLATLMDRANLKSSDEKIQSQTRPSSQWQIRNPWTQFALPPPSHPPPQIGKVLSQARPSSRFK